MYTISSPFVRVIGTSYANILTRGAFPPSSTIRSPSICNVHSPILDTKPETFLCQRERVSRFCLFRSIRNSQKRSNDPWSQELPISMRSRGAHSYMSAIREPKRNQRVAVVGAGYWGKNLVRTFHTLGALQTVCDINETTLDRVR